MITPRKTGFQRYFGKRMSDPKFAVEYAAVRAEIDATDKLVRALDVAREAAGLTKAELARRIGAQPEAIRRLLTSTDSNPTMETVFRLTAALGHHLELVPDGRRAAGRRTRARQTARGTNKPDDFAHMSGAERAKLHASLRQAEREIAAGRSTPAKGLVRKLRALK
jgi:transcriptional regulator with XRE-family HTH domain